MDKKLLGSITAKGGFKNEVDIVLKFNAYKTDQDAQKWLEIMGYNFLKIQSLHAVQIPVRINKFKAVELGALEEKVIETMKYKKADIQIQIEIRIDDIILRENISLKKANTNSNFNQIDKRAVSEYQKMWNFNEVVTLGLKKFTGEIIPNKSEQLLLRDSRRWYIDELNQNEREEILSFFQNNKIQVFNDILQGRGALSAGWFLVTRNNLDGKIDWILKDINFIVNFFSQGEITVSDRGGLKLGKLTAQRKGGTPDPKSLQFKISPLDLFKE